MDNKANNKDLQFNTFLYFIRGYFIPVIGVIVILLVIIFIYIPNTTGIFGDIGTISDKNTKYNQVRQKTDFYHSLSTTDNELKQVDALTAINTKLPDQVKSADAIDALQQVAQTDGVQVLSASGTLLQNNQLNGTITISPLVQVSEIILHVSGTIDNLKKLSTDISKMPQLTSINTSSWNGGLSPGTTLEGLFTVDVYFLDSNAISGSVDLLANVNTGYTSDVINNLTY